LFAAAILATLSKHHLRVRDFMEAMKDIHFLSNAPEAQELARPGRCLLIGPSGVAILDASAGDMTDLVKTLLLCGPVLLVKVAPLADEAAWAVTVSAVQSNSRGGSASRGGRTAPRSPRPT
jgi:hypothetical protein